MTKKNDAFRDWLKNTTPLLESSIQVYVYSVKRYLRLYGKINISDINKWISENARDKHNNHYKYALKKYLEYINRKDLIPKMVKTKVRPRDKVGNYYSPDVILKLIGNMGFYQPVALIQYTCGARSREALFLDRNKIIPSDTGMRVLITAKGGKEEEVIIPAPFSEQLKVFLEQRPGKYPFLKGENPDVTLWLNTNYRYYLRDLKRASIDMGIRFSTHDFRRNYAEEIKNITGGNIQAIKIALRHSQYTSTERYIRPTIGVDLQKLFVKKILS